MVRLLLTLWLLLPVACGLAADPAVPAYDLTGVIRTALQRHPSLQAAALDVAAARARTAQARAYARPQVSAEAGYTRLQDDPTFTVGGMGTLHFGAADNWTAALGVEYPLYTGGRLEALRAGAAAGVQAGEGDLARTRQGVALNAGRAYYRLLSCERMLPVWGEQVTALTAVLRTARALNEQGMVAKIDALRAEVALSAARTGLQQQEAARASAAALLVETMGLAPGTPLALEEKLERVEVPELKSELWQQAWQQRPDLQALAARRQALQAQVQVARSDARPQVGLFARSEFERATFYPETGVLSGGLLIRQKLGDGGAARAATTEAQARLDQLERLEEQTRYGIAAQVQVALSGLRSARARLDAAEPAVGLAREALRLAQIGYANGVTPLTDVLAAQAALAAARAEYENARSALGQAQVEFRYAMGEEPPPAG